MGWAVVQSKAQRPPAIQSRDILHVGEDLLLDDRDADEALVALDGQV